MNKDYADWRDRQVIINCLDDLGMQNLATKCQITQEIISKFTTIIVTEAKRLKRHGVLERLYFAGLIYG